MGYVGLFVTVTRTRTSHKVARLTGNLATSVCERLVVFIPPPARREIDGVSVTRRPPFDRPCKLCCPEVKDV